VLSCAAKPLRRFPVPAHQFLPHLHCPRIALSLACPDPTTSGPPPCSFSPCLCPHCMANRISLVGLDRVRGTCHVRYPLRLLRPGTRRASPGLPPDSRRAAANPEPVPAATHPYVVYDGSASSRSMPQDHGCDPLLYAETPLCPSCRPVSHHRRVLRCAGKRKNKTLETKTGTKREALNSVLASTTSCGHATLRASDTPCLRFPQTPPPPPPPPNPGGAVRRPPTVQARMFSPAMGNTEVRPPAPRCRLPPPEFSAASNRNSRPSATLSVDHPSWLLRWIRPLTLHLDAVQAVLVRAPRPA